MSRQTKKYRSSRYAQSSDRFSSKPRGGVMRMVWAKLGTETAFALVVVSGIRAPSLAEVVRGWLPPPNQLARCWPFREYRGGFAPPGGRGRRCACIRPRNNGRQQRHGCAPATARVYRAPPDRVRYK